MSMRRWLGLCLMIAALAALSAACKSEDTSKTLTLGSLIVNDHGATDVTGKALADLEVDNYYFSPSFLRGAPGQKVVVKISNDSKTAHNFTVKGVGIDNDIPPEGKVQVDVMFPVSGFLLFFCKFHTGQGMNGELLAGAALPSAP